MRISHQLNSLCHGTLTIVLAGGQGERLDSLTRERAKPAVPFGGSYRLIDFTLSNCINSGIRRIYILTQYMSTTLERHVHEAWNIVSGELNEFIQTVPPQRKMADRWYEGTADAIFHNINILQKETPQRVLILSGDHVYKMDYRKMLEFHLSREAHLTVGAVPVVMEQASRFAVLEIDREGRITSFEEKPANPKPLPNDRSKCLVSMGVYVFQTDTLVRALIEDAKKNTEHDFGRSIIPQVLEAGGRTYCYDFSTCTGKENNYWRDIGTIDSYWEASMDLLRVNPKFTLDDENWPIRSYQEQAAPAKIMCCGKFNQRTQVFNSLICGGCEVNATQVERSILSWRTHIGSGTQISESITMRDVQLGRNAKIRRAIIDEGVSIPEGYRIGYDPREDASRFVISPGGIVVVPAGMHLD